jgi:hypothetical protein
VGTGRKRDTHGRRELEVLVLIFFVSAGVLCGMSTYRTPRKPYRAPSASVIGHGPKKKYLPGFVHLTAGKQSSQEKGRSQIAPLRDPLSGIDRDGPNS